MTLDGTPGRRDRRADAAIVVTLALIAVGGVALEMRALPTARPVGVGYLIAALTPVPLMWRRTRPALAAPAVLVIASLYPLLGYPGWAPAAVLFVAFYSLAAYGASRRATIGAVALSAVVYAVPLLTLRDWSPLAPALWAPAAAIAWISLLGGSVRRRRLEAEDRARRAAEAAAVAARERLTGDRLRIARELHDVLAHTISVIAVQSGLAIDALDDDIPAVRGALGVIRASTRQALAELRATLELLRAEAEGGVPERPQPGLAQLPELVERARTAGLAVDLSLDHVGPLPPAVELTVYRLVQEALTNVLRHAGAGRATVTLRTGDGTVTVEVTDDGRGPAAGGTTGFGLRGMAERVAAVGGTLVTGPGPDGGFEVRAELPR